MSPPKTVNKSKISTTFNQGFMPTKLKKVPKKFSVYLPTDLPNNGSPRTAYDRRGLYKHFSTQSRLSRNTPPRSPMTRKPVHANKWYYNLYTNEEIQAAKHKKSHKYKLIEHMKTRKHLSAKQKLEYLNELKNGKKLNNLINEINKFTIAKQNIPVETRKNRDIIQTAVQILDNVNTNHKFFRSKDINKKDTNAYYYYGNTALDMVKLIKKVRTFILEKIVEVLKKGKNKKEQIRKILKDIPELERTLQAVGYLELIDDENYNSSSNMAKMMNSAPRRFRYFNNSFRNKLYDYIKKNIFTLGGLTKIQVFITYSYMKNLFGTYRSDKDLYQLSKNIVWKTKVGSNNKGFDILLYDQIISEEYSDEIYDAREIIRDILMDRKIYNVNHNFAFNIIEPVDMYVKRLLKSLIYQYYPKMKNEKVYINRINKMTSKNFFNVEKMLPKHKKK